MRVYTIINLDPLIEDLEPYISKVVIRPNHELTEKYALKDKIGTVIATYITKGSIGVRYENPNGRTTVIAGYGNFMLVSELVSELKENNPNRTFKRDNEKTPEKFLKHAGRYFPNGSEKLKRYEKYIKALERSRT